MLELPPETVKWMQDHNIQHVVLRSTPEGIVVLFNGKQLPNLVWNDEYLKNGADLYSQLYMLDDNVRQSLEALVPAVSKADAEVTLMFPTAPGAEPIPVPTASQ
jgi:hypothetical protein